MESNPLVSIITGFYNREFMVDDSIQSLINQSYRNVEIIIFEDCSTDKTLEKLEAFEKKDCRIVLLKHKTNKGFVQGLIDAIGIAKGTLIAIHGSGDISLPTRIEKQVDVHRNMPNVSVVGCYYENWRNNKLESRVEKRNGLDFLSQMQKKNIFSHGEVMFKKDAYENSGGYRLAFKYSQDSDLWFRMALFSEYYIVEEVLYIRLNDDSNSVKNNPIKQLEQAMYSELARQSISLRMKKHYDFVDLLGISALGILNVTNRYSTLALRTVILTFLRGDEIQFNHSLSILRYRGTKIHIALGYLMKYKLISRKMCLYVLKIFYNKGYKYFVSSREV